MKYYATIDDQTYEIAIDQPGHITVDGAELAADMRLVTGRHLYSLLLNNNSYEIVLDPDGSERSLHDVMVGGQRHLVKVQDERSRRLAAADRSVRTVEVEAPVKAPIPGLVVKVNVVPGQSVGEGETVVIVEAMKMENELRAPRAGQIHDVRVTPGAQVALGQVLVTIK
jgi:biotin carboxyl carrier protein